MAPPDLFAGYGTSFPTLQCADGTGSTSTAPIRARYDDDTITVYQAYSDEIADPALAARQFVSPFKLTRMTWIKPLFLWMMYRSDWATKPGQERILAISLLRTGFEAALASSCLSHFDAATYRDHDESLRMTIGASPE